MNNVAEVVQNIIVAYEDTCDVIDCLYHKDSCMPEQNRLFTGTSRNDITADTTA